MIIQIYDIKSINKIWSIISLLNRFDDDNSDIRCEIWDKRWSIISLLNRFDDDNSDMKYDDQLLSQLNRFDDDNSGTIDPQEFDQVVDKIYDKIFDDFSYFFY